ncbi:hypothetical protein [Dactylosporangium darangshiense]|uniref:Lipoprotein n=1 Tax=Dactylosporangium darangshiense TaxID=579108 RepID=A0ABP8CXB8_9ACTN
MRFLTAAAVAAAVLVLATGCGGDTANSTAQAAAGATSAAAPASADPGTQACRDVKAVHLEYFAKFSDVSAKALDAIQHNDHAAAESLQTQEAAAAKDWNAKLEPLAPKVTDPELRSAADAVLAALKRYAETLGVTVGDVLKAGAALTTALNKACG